MALIRCVEPPSLALIADPIGVSHASEARAGWRRVLVGSVARRIAQTVPTPVIVCPVPLAPAADERSPEQAAALGG